MLSLGELAAQVKHLPERHVGQVWVTGEVTNLPAQSSGHICFTRKEAAAQLSCVPRQGAIELDDASGKRVNLQRVAEAVPNRVLSF